MRMLGCLKRSGHLQRETDRVCVLHKMRMDFHRRHVAQRLGVDGGGGMHIVLDWFRR